MNNLTVLITGASSGIGYEFARIFAKKKNNLILVARNKKRLEGIRAELLANDITIHMIEKDLSLPQAALEVYKEVKSLNLRVDILINSAGSGLQGNFDELDLHQQRLMMQLNMVSLTELTHLFVKEMIGRKFGRILNIGSIASFVSMPSMSVYAATKSYVLSFSESMSNELKQYGDITVTALCPGLTKTNFVKAANMGSMEEMYNRFGMSPSRVAMEGYDALVKGRPIMIPGKRYRLSIMATRFLPRKFVQRLIMYANK